jgi:hypothetical protein
MPAYSTLLAYTMSAALEHARVPQVINNLNVDVAQHRCRDSYF